MQMSSNSPIPSFITYNQKSMTLNPGFGDIGTYKIIVKLTNMQILSS